MDQHVKLPRSVVLDDDGAVAQARGTAAERFLSALPQSLYQGAPSDGPGHICDTTAKLLSSVRFVGREIEPSSSN